MKEYIITNLENTEPDTFTIVPSNPSSLHATCPSNSLQAADPHTAPHLPSYKTSTRLNVSVCGKVMSRALPIGEPSMSGRNRINSD